MAIHNEAILYGIVEKTPIVSVVDNKPVKGSAYLTVIKGDRTSEDHEKKKGFTKVYNYTPLPILTKDPDVLDSMKDWKINDLILIKGNVITANVTKDAICPHCGEVYHKEGAVITYINPIHASIEKSFSNKDKAVEELKNHTELSNYVTILGTVCKTPEATETWDNCIRFPIAINRKYFVPGDDPEDYTDYPWVHCYGEKNLSAAERCQVGTNVFLEGTLRVRKYPELSVVCGGCGKTFPWKDITIDFIPYAIELLNNFITDEMIEEEEKEEATNILAEMGLKKE